MKKSRTTIQGNGITERFDVTILKMLGTLSPMDKADWKEHVETLTHAYNVTKHDSTGFSPYVLMFGRHPRLPVDLVFSTGRSELELVENTSDYILKLQELLREAYKIAAMTSIRA